MHVGVVACNGRDMNTVWMWSKRAAPKERKVCQPCADWLVGEKLADIARTAFSCMCCVVLATAYCSLPTAHCPLRKVWGRVWDRVWGRGPETIVFVTFSGPQEQSGPETIVFVRFGAQTGHSDGGSDGRAANGPRSGHGRAMVGGRSGGVGPELRGRLSAQVGAARSA